MSFQEGVFRFANEHLAPYRFNEGTGQISARFCPICHGGGSGDRNTFAINVMNGLNSCRRGSCGWSGSFAELLKQLGIEEEKYIMSESLEKYRLPQMQRSYSLPNTTLYGRTETINSYFARRKISESTLDHYQIAATENGDIVFPFYENGVLTYVKFRHPRKVDRNKEWQAENTKPILFGMDLCNPVITITDDNGDVVSSTALPLIITEGQIDAMACYEAGLPNAVSVPCGVDQMAWIENCWDFMEQFQQIILFGDSDAPGKRMVEEVIRRLGTTKCVAVESYPDRIDGKPCKDANEILYYCGAEVLVNVVKHASELKPRGLLDLADVDDSDDVALPRIATGIPRLDQAINGLEAGTITICTGQPGDGKSTLLGQFILSAVEQGHNICCYSGELPAKKFKEWLTFQCAGSDYITLKHDDVKDIDVPYVPPEIKRAISDWFRGHVFLFDNREKFDVPVLDAVLEVFQIAAERYGCDMLVADNVLTITADSEDEYKEQNRFMTDFNRLILRHNAAGVVVAHARKTPSGQDTIRLNDVSGNSAITKLASSVLVIEKPDVRIIKARDTGNTMLIPMCYCPDSRRVYQKNIGDKAHFSWNKTGIPPVRLKADSRMEYQIQTKTEPF